MGTFRSAAGAALVFCAFMSGTSAQAAVMTFTGLPGEGGLTTEWIENGITATPTGVGGLGYKVIEDAAHLDDGGSSFAWSITFTMGQIFDAISFDILPFDNSFGAPYDNVEVTGIRNNTAVAADTFYMSEKSSKFLFDESFLQLDSLVIASLFPNGFCFAPCAHFSIDNLTLASATPTPIPLPSAILFLLSALGLTSTLTAVARRRSREPLGAAVNS